MGYEYIMRMGPSEADGHEALFFNDTNNNEVIDANESFYVGHLDVKQYPPPARSFASYMGPNGCRHFPLSTTEQPCPPPMPGENVPWASSNSFAVQPDEINNLREITTTRELRGILRSVGIAENPVNATLDSLRKYVRNFRDLENFVNQSEDNSNSNQNFCYDQTASELRNLTWLVESSQCTTQPSSNNSFFANIFGGPRPTVTCSITPYRQSIEPLFEQAIIKVYNQLVECRENDPSTYLLPMYRDFPELIRAVLASPPFSLTIGPDTISENHWRLEMLSLLIYGVPDRLDTEDLIIDLVN